MEILYSPRTSAEFSALEAELDALHILRKRPHSRGRCDASAIRSWPRTATAGTAFLSQTLCSAAAADAHGVVRQHQLQ